MSKTAYNIQLKGYVGGVNGLIDSLGGSLATGLSIFAAFKNHGDVAVHLTRLYSLS